jgi:hypothetical protein
MGDRTSGTERRLEVEILRGSSCINTRSVCVSISL